MKVLITGANGFVGSHLVEGAIDRGWEVYAGVRSERSRQALGDVIKHDRLRFINFDLADLEGLGKVLNETAGEIGGFDYVIHSAAVTQPNTIEAFYQYNADLVRDFAEILRDTQPSLKKFIYLSSLAALGPGDPESMEPITESQEARPITPYGKSKRQGEEFLLDIGDLPLIILRPCPVYGPRDTKFFGRLANTLRLGFDIRFGAANQKLSFVHVDDLVQVTLDAAGSNRSGEDYNIADGQAYDQDAFYRYLKSVMDASTVRIRLPKAFLMPYGFFSLYLSRAFGKPVHLSHHKMRELTSRNWAVDITKASEQLGFQPKYTIQKGIEQTFRQLQK